MFVGMHVGYHSTYVHNKRGPCCPIRALRKTCFTAVTWKRFKVTNEVVIIEIWIHNL